MEHADIISGAYTYTKEALLGQGGFSRWLILFIYIVGPVVAGFLVAALVCQMILLPILVNFLVNNSFGFTGENLSAILMYLATLIGVACIFLVPLMQGYCYRILRSGNELPPLHNTWGLFFNGWRMNITLIIYAIPLLITSLVYALIFLYFFPDAGIYAPAEVIEAEGFWYVATVFSYSAIQFITLICISLFALVGLAHLANTGSIAEAVGFTRIAGIIRKIGWYDYLLAIVIMSILFLLLLFVLISVSEFFQGNIIAIGILTGLYIFVLIPVVLFITKYLSEVYNTAFHQDDEDDMEFDDF
jgi:hypothetical protein